MIYNHAVLLGKIVSSGPLEGRIAGGTLVGRVTTGSSAPVEKYPGPYSVTPTRDGVTLPTKDNIMAEDMVVEKVPYSAVENLRGGNTIYIGG